MSRVTCFCIAASLAAAALSWFLESWFWLDWPSFGFLRHFLLTTSLHVDGFFAPASGASSPAIAGRARLLRLMAPSASSANRVGAVMRVVRNVFGMGSLLLAAIDLGRQL